ncbi:MAG: hypothetical protein NC210_00130 [[Clostridium] fimetarium]|nr:hypothetical protein [Alistipes timonensis]MCM1404813.1 hypothetical protein [[Clostridium] fimetarium]
MSEFYVADNVAAIAKPFAVLLGCGLIHLDFALFYELLKPILAANNLSGSGFAEHNRFSGEFQGNQVQNKVWIRDMGRYAGRFE